jgi:predicted transcriptional regulator
MYDYLSQMRDAADQIDVDLLTVVKAAGIPSSTYWRWMNGVAPSELVTRRVLETIGGMGEASHGGQARELSAVD